MRLVGQMSTELHKNHKNDKNALPPTRNLQGPRFGVATWKNTAGPSHEPGCGRGLSQHFLCPARIPTDRVSGLYQIARARMDHRVDVLQSVLAQATLRFVPVSL